LLKEGAVTKGEAGLMVFQPGNALSFGNGSLLWQRLSLLATALPFGNALSFGYGPALLQRPSPLATALSFSDGPALTTALPFLSSRA
jgi:hypothetical protein